MQPSDLQQDGCSLTVNVLPYRAKLYLCTSYALAAWAWRSWEFIVALVLIELYPNSLLMVSAYGLLDNLARVVLGPVVGTYIDSYERLPGARAMLLFQNQCIGGSAAAALVLLWPGSPAERHHAAYWPLMWLLTLLGAASSAGSTGVSISVEREAVKALCGADGRALASLNATMRAIDLSALLLAPLAAGLLMTAAGPFMAAGGMAAYCCVAYLPEVLLLGAAFRAAPVLGQPKVRTSAVVADADTEGPGGAATANKTDERTGLLDGYDSSCMDTSTHRHRDAKDGHEASCTAYAANGQPAMRSANATPPANGRAAPAIGVMNGRRASGEKSHADDASGGGGDAGAAGGRAESTSITSAALLSSPLTSTHNSYLTSEQPLGVGTARSSNPAANGGVCENGKKGDDSGDITGTLSLESCVSECGTAAEKGTTSDTAMATAAKSAFIMSPRASFRRVVAAAVRRHCRTLCRSSSRAWASYTAAWHVYLSSGILMICLALALLYMTVLSLGFLMTSFLKWSGLSEVEVSAYRGVGALTGLAATALFPQLSARAGLRFCAAAGITYQLACLTAGVVPTVIRVVAAGRGGGAPHPPSVGTVRLLVGGLVSSRTGLWMYDLAVTQAIQESVRQDELGALYGVQSSLQAAMEMMSFVAGLASPAPWHFHWLMLGSLCSVGTATALVWSHVLAGRRRPEVGRGAGGRLSEDGVAA